MNNASKGRCVTVTPSGIEMGIFAVAQPMSNTSNRSRKLDIDVVSWFSNPPSLAGESALKVPWSSG